MNLQPHPTIFSLFRLRHALKVGEVLPEILNVGGRYFAPPMKSAEAKTAHLTNADLTLEIAPLTGVDSGDWVVVTAQSENLHLDAGHLRLSSVSSFENTGSTGKAKLSSPLWPHAELWSKFLWATRQFFHDRGLLEMTTPSLVKNPGMEPELEPFATEWRSGSQRASLFLPTSPELHLKQLMVQGYTDIFEIKSVFRNEELTENHEPEFSMLEWYRGFANLDLITRDLEDLIRYFERKVFSPGPKPGEARDLRSGVRESLLERYSIRQILQQFADFELRPETTHAELTALAEKLDLEAPPDMSWNDLFHFIWVSKIENQLPKTPFLLHDYPPSQAALARLTPAGWADRCEFFWGGIEIANAFHELTDPVEQRRRFQNDQEIRQAYGRTPLAIDENFMRALEVGLPPSAGIALGLDRLFMVMAGLKDLRSTRAFSVSHQVQN